MTGRELIVYILENKLEDVDFFTLENQLPGMLTVEEAAVKWHMGMSTVKTLYTLGKIKGCKIGGEIFVWDKERE